MLLFRVARGSDGGGVAVHFMHGAFAMPIVILAARSIFTDHLVWSPLVRGQRG